ncbi:hypothetical protein SEA_BEEGEE_78 [Gordonia phage BeeGee]|nr:hypothetical protein SEA_BEEGEE_78 [Gordonia phage BeeGee]
MTIVNRVPTLHRPPPEGASVAEIVAYWQRRLPFIDMRDVTADALLQVAAGLSAAGLTEAPNALIDELIAPLYADGYLDAWPYKTLRPNEEPTQ